MNCDVSVWNSVERTVAHPGIPLAPTMNFVSSCDPSNIPGQKVYHFEWTGEMAIQNNPPISTRKGHVMFKTPYKSPIPVFLRA